MHICECLLPVKVSVCVWTQDLFPCQASYCETRTEHCLISSFDMWFSHRRSNPWKSQRHAFGERFQAAQLWFVEGLNRRIQEPIRSKVIGFSLDSPNDWSRVWAWNSAYSTDRTHSSQPNAKPPGESLIERRLKNNHSDSFSCFFKHKAQSRARLHPLWCISVL